MSNDCTLYIVDDDDPVRDSLTLLLTAQGAKVKSYASAINFLNDYRYEGPGILIADIRMPDMTGLELQDRIVAQKIPLPIIFITGHGDIPLAVSTVKKGASAFIEKPFSDKDLKVHIDRLYSEAYEMYAVYQERVTYQKLYERLTERERSVLNLISNGRLNKQIADDLSISIKTVEAHRANIMEKLEASTVADLMRIFFKINEHKREP
ncbi:response regulator transcription factor [Basilea psittacipulmonis]|uniref:response regulator transcription factor n=1 Tax=Basilea psittacipulmonis TaxID=1472345 RepID=UPI0006905517|nr:response regulator [Basilea psittacipulmonis]